MAVKTYSGISTEQISPHFNVQEFKCKCGKTHDTLVSEELTEKLEKLRDSLNCSKIIITSGYRCPEHDRNVGGTGSGQHTKGKAADFVCYDKDGNAISSKLVCCKAQDLGFTGIANITANYDCTHGDVRSSGKWYGNEVYGTGNVTNDFYSYYGIQKSGTILAKGIDVSYAQKEPDWDKVKASGEVDFVLIRAGYGREAIQIDSQFERNYRECRRLGIPCGVYWYSYAMSAAEAQQEANVFLQAIKGKQFEYPVYMDLEEPKQFTLGKAKCSEIAEAFLSVIEKAGYYAGLYCSTSYLASHISDSVKNRYVLWVAQYNNKCTCKNSYGIWQYGVAGHPEHDTFNTGSVTGISGRCDLDYCYADYPAIIKKSGLNGFAKQETEAVPDETELEKDTLEEILEHIKSIDEKLS